jgi:predicted transcriptional regulator
MQNAGITEFVLDQNDFIFAIQGNKRRTIQLSRSEQSISAIIKKIVKSLTKELDGSDKVILEHCLHDIEDQLIERRSEIFNLPNSDNQKSNSKEGDENDPDRRSKKQFVDDVNNLREKFKESRTTYEQWQSIVADHYKKLKTVTKKHYPEAWPILEFCLSIKTILNVQNFTLPFMGIILAAPASMKTTIIQLFRKYLHSFYTDSFTPGSLISHNSTLKEEQLRKIDMIPKMKNKLFLAPELAPLFTAKEDDLQKVLGSLTRLLDGHGLENDSGVHGHRRYGDTMFVGVGAAVEIPPKVWKLLGTLGHKVYFIRPELKEKSVRKLKDIAKKNDFGDKFKEIEEAVLDYLKIFEAAPETEGKVIYDGVSGLVKIRWNEEVEGEQDKAIEHIAEIAKLLAHLRGTVNVRQSFNLTIGREPNSILEPEYYLDEPIREDASRAVISLRNLAIGHAISQGRDSINLQDIPMVIKVALSTTMAPRAKVFDLLIKNNGELSTSDITSHLKMSYPTARRILEELHFLDIVDIASVAEYTNSEVKITLKQEYQWFKNDEFRKFVNEVNEEQESEPRREESRTDSKETESSDKRAETNSDTDNLTDQTDHNILNTVNNTLLACDTVTCHTLKKNLPHTQRKNIFNEAIDKKEDVSLGNGSSTDMTDPSHHHESAENKRDYIEDVNYTKNSNSSVEERGHSPAAELDYSIINNNNKVQSLNRSDSYQDLDVVDIVNDSDNNSTNNFPVPVGSEYFQRVTASHDENGDDCHTEFESKINTGIEDIVFQEVLSIIESAKGLQIAVSTAVASAWNAHEQIRNYLGDKLTTRDNRRIRDLYLRIIRHPSIEVIKHKPQLIVRWSDKELSSDTQYPGSCHL